MKAICINPREVTTDVELLDCLKTLRAHGDIGSFRQRRPLPPTATPEQIMTALKEDITELKNTSAATLFRSFYAGRNLHFLKIKIRRERLRINFHRYVKENCKISKSWTNKIIAFYCAYKPYAKLMMCNISFESMYSLRKRILNLMKEPASITWYNAL